MNGVCVAKKKSKAEKWAAAFGALLGEAGGLFLGAWLIMLVLGAILPGLGAGYLTIAGLLFCLSIATGVSIGIRLEGLKKAIREPHEPAVRVGNITTANTEAVFERHRRNPPESKGRR